MRNTRLEKAQAEIKIARRNINNLRYVDDNTLMAETKEELKSLLMKVKEGSEKAGVKLNIQRTKIMVSSPITSWQIDGENNGNFVGLYFLGLQNHCRWWLQPWNLKTLLLGRKPLTNLDSILKSRDITLPTKVHLVKAMVFPVVMYGCESWAIKKAECGRIDDFELWSWTILLRVPWTARRSNQSILKEINPGCSLEGLMLKLKLQYLGHLMQRGDSLEKTWCWERLRAGGEGDDRGWDGWMASLTRLTWVWAGSRSWWWTGKPGMLQSMESQRVGNNWVTELTGWLRKAFLH